MKVSATLLAIALAFSATATPTPVQRDLSSIESLDAVEKAYTGGDTTALQNASDAVVSATNAGTDTASASADLSDTDALQLVSPIRSLTTDVQDAVNDIIAIKSEIAATGAQSQTLSDLIAQNTSATALANAITAKVPAELQRTAASLAAGVTNAIQQGIDAYSS